MNAFKQLINLSCQDTNGYLDHHEVYGVCTMHEHVIALTNITIRLKTLEMEVDENFLVKFIIV